MFAGLWALLYPLSSFVFLRGTFRCLAAWAIKPKPIYLIGGVLFMGLTLHGAWHLFGYVAVLPYWWVTLLVAVAYAWISWKNLRHIWQFQRLRNQTG